MPTLSDTHRARIDAGRTLLPLCTCGWRGQPTGDRVTAWHQAARHEQAEHPRNGQAAAKAYAAARRRANAETVSRAD